MGHLTALTRHRVAITYHTALNKDPKEWEINHLILVSLGKNSSQFQIQGLHDLCWCSMKDSDPDMVSQRHEGNGIVNEEIQPVLNSSRKQRQYFFSGGIDASGEISV